MGKFLKTAALLLFAGTLLGGAASSTALSVSAAPDPAQIVKQLVPTRDSEFGATVGELILLSDGKTVVQNYEKGYVTAELISDTQVQNKRDVGGMHMDESGQRTFVGLEDWIKSRPADGDVRAVWSKLDYKYNGPDDPLAYDPSYALGKIYEEYALLCEQGYNCGIPTDNLSVWDEAVIKLDFYDGDSEYGFDNSNRVHVTSIAYSFYKDSAYMIAGEVFNFYKNAKAGSLAEPISDPFDYTLDGAKGQVQAFAQGYIFLPEKGDIVIRAGARYNEETEEFDLLELGFDELTKTEITQVAIDSNPYYGGKGFTVQSVKELFYDKYTDLIDHGYNPGIPDAEGIFYWDSEVLKQAYVGSDGTGDAWGRTNMMLILNPDTGEVYKVSGEILNIVDESSQGLGTAKLLGYPLSDEKTQVINGFTYIYQDFSTGTIYSIENSPQLTRYIKGKTFATVTQDNSVLSPNNPTFFYVLEPWAIVLVCVGGGVLIAGGIAAAVLIPRILKKKKESAEEEEI